MEISKNRRLVFLKVLFLFCSVMLSLLLFCLMNQGRTKREGWSTPPSREILLLPVRRISSFGCLVILDVVCCYLLLFLLYINTVIGKIDA